VGPFVSWILASAFAAWALVRVLGWDAVFPLAQLIAFTPHVAAASVVAVAAALLSRQWWAAGLAVLACVTLAVCVLPRTIGEPSTIDGVALRVMSINMLRGGADPRAIVAQVRDRRVDVLTVQEFTNEAEAALIAAGMASELPYGESHPMDDTRGSGLFSRYPMTDGGVTPNPGGFLQAFGTVGVPGAQAVAVESVHPMAPAVPSTVPLWREDLHGQKRDSPTGPPRILSGDFNATLDHSQLRDIMDSGYQDAADILGEGLVPTWPYYGRRAAVTPKVTIDHILVDPRIGVRDFAAVAVPLTDHRAIVATLTIPVSP
jgi:endonuclease/exonuclease/phosphatase (EEP) superfamily protein YafD